MARRAAEAALDTPAPAPTTHRVRTTAQNDADARALCERRAQIHAAARWALTNERGARSACSTGLFGDVTRNMVAPVLRELKETGIEDPRDHHNQILINSERRKLAKWILACTDGQDPKDRTHISSKIRELLKARHASNKRRKWGTGTVRLTEPEIAAVEST